MSLPPGMSDHEMALSLLREVGRQGIFDMLVRLAELKAEGGGVMETRTVVDPHGVKKHLVSPRWHESSPRRQRVVEKPLTTEAKSA
jgi:hypothetical protein